MPIAFRQVAALRRAGREKDRRQGYYLDPPAVIEELQEFHPGFAPVLFPVPELRQVLPVASLLPYYLGWY